MAIKSMTEVNGFGKEFVARFRGFKNVCEVATPNAAVTASNAAYGMLGFGIMSVVKHGICRNTKFGKWTPVSDWFGRVARKNLENKMED